MAHHTNKPVYHQLVDRLNRFPQGAPPSELLDKRGDELAAYRAVVNTLLPEVGE